MHKVLKEFKNSKLLDPIIYNIPFGENGNDFLSIAQQIKTASLVLESRLAKRDCGFTFLQLELKTTEKYLEVEKKLSKVCNEASVLANLLMDLLQQAELKEALEHCVIKLSAFSPLNWQAPDLFAMASRREIQQREKNLANVLNQLEHKFPGLFDQGKEIRRREEVLALWDPWRQ